MKACALIRENLNRCSQCVHFSKCRVLLGKDTNEWSIEEFVTLDDAVVLEFVEEALEALGDLELARKLLGHMYGI